MKYRIKAIQRDNWLNNYEYGKSFYIVQVKFLCFWFEVSKFETLKQARECIRLLKKEY